MSDYERRPPLLDAIERGTDLSEVERLLDAGANVNEHIVVRDPGGHSVLSTTPLMAAARAGRPDVVRLLLQRNAHPDGTSFDYTPLTLLVREGYCDPEVVRLLVEA